MIKQTAIGRNDPCPCFALKENGSRNKYKNCCAKSFVAKPTNFARKLNMLELKMAVKEHAKFIEAHARGECYICLNRFDTYDLQKPCLHWFLRPQKIKKTDILKVLNKEGCFKTQTFLRWLANTENFGFNINDFVEIDSLKVFETTIKYKNLEWSFTCSPSDFIGHKDSNWGRESHFHFQMLIDGHSFIKYSDFHPIFTFHDKLILKLKKNQVSGVVYKEAFAVGINDVIDEMVESNLDGMKVAPDEASAQFRLGTIVQASPGTSFSADEFLDLQQESNTTGVPLAILLRRLKNVSTETNIEPGSAIPPKAVRSNPRK